jgi:hypothetical protein
MSYGVTSATKRVAVKHMKTANPTKSTIPPARTPVVIKMVRIGVSARIRMRVAILSGSLRI